MRPSLLSFELEGLNQVGGLTVAAVSHRRKGPPCLKSPIRKPFAYLPPGVTDDPTVEPIRRNAIPERSPLTGPTALLAIKYASESPNEMQEEFFRQPESSFLPAALQEYEPAELCQVIFESYWPPV